MKKIVLKIINFYQATLSPDHSARGKHCFPNGYCRYFPSCSEYTKQAIIKNGLFKGFFQGIYRLLRCNPLLRGGLDLVK